MSIPSRASRATPRGWYPKEGGRRNGGGAALVRYSSGGGPRQQPTGTHMRLLLRHRRAKVSPLLCRLLTVTGTRRIRGSKTAANTGEHTSGATMAAEAQHSHP